MISFGLVLAVGGLATGRTAAVSIGVALATLGVVFFFVDSLQRADNAHRW